MTMVVKNVKIKLGFSMALAILIVVGITAFQSMNMLGSRTRHREIQLLVSSVLSMVKDAESGQRGYLLTLKESYLEPYLRAKNSLTSNLGKLHEMLVGLGDADQLEAYSALQSLIEQRMDLLAQVLEIQKGEFG